jgi:hypothetical protein
MVTRMTAKRIATYPFDDTRFSYSGFIIRNRRIKTIGTGGHSATALSTIDDLGIDDAVPQWREEFPPLPYAIMRQFRAVTPETPALPNRATWTDTAGKYAGQTIHGILCGPAGTTYTHDHLTEDKFWVHPDYKSAWNTFHGYHSPIYSPETDRAYRTLGNNEMNSGLAGPIGQMAKGGRAGYYDFSTEQFVALPEGIGGMGTSVCRDPSTGYFVSVGLYGEFKVFDPRTHTTVAEVGDLRMNRSRYWLTPYTTSPFFIASSLVWDTGLNGAVYISARDRRTLLIRLGPDFMPTVRELAVRSVEGCPLPDDDNSNIRKLCPVPDGRIVGGLRLGFMWHATVSETEIVWDRTDLTHFEMRRRRVRDAAGKYVVPAQYEDYPCRLGPEKFGSCHAIEECDGTVYFMAEQLTDPLGGTGNMALYAWDVTPPDTKLTITKVDDYATSVAVKIEPIDVNAGPFTFKGRLNAAEFADVEAEFTLADLAVGAYAYEAYAIDAAGNADPTPARAEFIVAAPPEEPPEEEPEGPPVVVTERQVWDGATGTTATMYDHRAGIRWRRKFGDWLDANGDAFGPDPFAKAFAKRGVPFVQDVTALVRRTGAMLLKASSTVRIAGRLHPVAAERPTLILTRPDGTQATLECSAFQGQGSTTVPSIKEYANLDANWNAVVQFPDRGEFTSARLQLTVLAYGATVSVYELWFPPIFDIDAHTPEPGLASKYRDDVDLVKDPKVLFVDRFEKEYPEVEREWRKYFYHPAGRTNNRVETGGPLGGPYLATRIATGKSAADSLRTHEFSRRFVNGGDGVTGGRITARFNPHNGLRTTLDHGPSASGLPERGRPDPSHPGAFEELFFRRYLRFHEDFMDCVPEGNKLHGLCGQYGDWNGVQYYTGGAGNGGNLGNGRRSAGGVLSGFTMLTHLARRAADGNPIGKQLLRALGIQAYHVTAGGQWGDMWDFGDATIGRVLVGPMRWIGIEEQVKLNSVRGATAEEQAAYIAKIAEDRAQIIAHSEGNIRYYRTRIQTINDAIAGGVATPEQLLSIRTLESRIASNQATIDRLTTMPLPTYDADGFDQYGNGEGAKDGIVRCWVYGHKADGTPVGRMVFEKTDVVVRRHPWLKIDAAWFCDFHGGNYPAEHDHHFDEANVAIATEYIGPLAA